MNSQELRALQEAYSQVYAPQELDEAEGSYGQTPKAQQKMGDLANKRRNTPASEYSERGEKKKKVDSASRHFNRMGNPDAGNKGKKSSRPYYPAGRKGMTQKDRDWSRGADEYGHSGYDGEGGGGSLPKGKKLERQRKTGVSAESFDLYDIILSHLLDEGFASDEKSAEAILGAMSEAWVESIVEGRELDPTKVPTIDSPGGAGGRVTIDKPYPATLGGKKGVKSTDERGSEYFMPYKPQGGLPKPSTLPDFDKAQYKNTYTNTYKDIPARQSTKNPQSHLSRTGVPRVHRGTATYGIDD